MSIDVAEPTATDPRASREDRPQPSPGENGRGPGKLGELLRDPRGKRAANGLAAVLIFYFVTQFFWPAPIGVLVQGTIIGGLTALIAFGLSLVYRANRIINFAQGDMGAAGATLAVLLIVGPGWPYWFAMPTGLIAGALLGGIVEFAVIRRFFNAPRLILTVVTILLAQVMAGIALLLPTLFDFNLPPQSFPSPFDFAFEIDPIVFRGNDIIAMLAVPAAILGLVALFRFTNIGLAIRGSAESSERAALVGIPVKRIQTIVWVLAASLATIAVILRAGIVGLPVGQVLGPAILLRALAAAVIGRMERLPTIFVAAVALGIIETSIVWHTGRALLVAPVLFVVILGALIFQRRGEGARTDEQSSWQSAKAFRPLPRELANVREVKWAGAGLRWGLIGILVVLPALIPESRINLVAAVLIFALIGVSLVVLTGWGGQVSLGQMAFVGFGAAVAGSVVGRLEWDPLIGLLGAGVVGALVAFVIGLPALRMKGLFLAVTTLAFALTTSQYLLNQEFFSWWLPDGRFGRPHVLGRINIETETRYYYFVLFVFLVAVWAVARVRRSRPGRIMISTRENDRATQAFGVNATRAKLTAFGLSGFFAALAGGLFAFHQQSLGVNAFTPEQSLNVFVMVVIGGLGSIPGALIGASVIQGFDWFLPSSLSFIQFFTSGIGAIVILMLLPGGLSQIPYQIRDALLRQVAQRRNILVPSLVADARDAERMAERREERRQQLAAALHFESAERPETDAALEAVAPQSASATALAENEVDEAVVHEAERAEELLETGRDPGPEPDGREPPAGSGARSGPATDRSGNGGSASGESGTSGQRRRQRRSRPLVAGDGQQERTGGNAGRSRTRQTTGGRR